MYLNKKIFIVNSAILVSAALIARIIGIIFRVYMSNKIGAEGIGLYQLILIIYMFVVTLVAQGISLSVTKLVTDCLAVRDCKKALIITRRCIILGIILSSICACGLFQFASQISQYILHDTRATLSLKVLSIGLPFLAVSACFRGFFLATRNVIKSASEQLIEQVVEISVFAILIGKLAPLGIEYACCAIVIGTTVAEIVSFIYSYVMFVFEKKKLICLPKKQEEKSFIREFLGTFLPITGSATLRSGLSIAENVMIPSGLKKYGASYENSLASYGMITGMVMPVITFPSAFLMSFSMLLIPEFSEANVLSKTKDIHAITEKVFAITFYFSIFVTGIFICFGKDLGVLIYNSETTGMYISLLAPVLPLMYLDSIVDGMLKGLGEAFSYFKYNLIDSVIRVTLTMILIPIIGINGLIIVIFVSEILNSTLSILKLMKVTSLKMEVMKWIIKPALAILFPGILFLVTNEIMIRLVPILLERVILEIIISLVVYISLLLLMNCIKIKKNKVLQIV